MSSHSLGPRVPRVPQVPRVSRVPWSCMPQVPRVPRVPEVPLESQHAGVTAVLMDTWTRTRVRLGSGPPWFLSAGRRGRWGRGRADGNHPYIVGLHRRLHLGMKAPQLGCCGRRGCHWSPPCLRGWLKPWQLPANWLLACIDELEEASPGRAPVLGLARLAMGIAIESSPAPISGDLDGLATAWRPHDDEISRSGVVLRLRLSLRLRVRVGAGVRVGYLWAPCGE